MLQLVWFSTSKYPSIFRTNSQCCYFEWRLWWRVHEANWVKPGMCNLTWAEFMAVILCSFAPTSTKSKFNCTFLTVSLTKKYRISKQVHDDSECSLLHRTRTLNCIIFLYPFNLTTNTKTRNETTLRYACTYNARKR